MSEPDEAFAPLDIVPGAVLDELIEERSWLAARFGLVTWPVNELAEVEAPVPLAPVELLEPGD